MNKYTKIRIETFNDDITIKDGHGLKIIGGKYRIEGDTLIIQAKNDFVLELPNGNYESLEIVSVNGDAEIEVRLSSFQELHYHGVNGDLTGFINCPNIFFDCSCGDCYINSSSTTRITVSSSTVDERVEGERYQ